MGLIVDLFAGGGGASTGIEWALGRSPDIAINHDPMALAMHKANHPTTKHLVENVWHVRPKDIIGDQPVDLLWASPDCTHFSKAKGAAPKRDINRAKRSRGLAWVILRWAKHASPRLILMENVEEWIDWGPLLKDGRPDPKRKGETRKRFVRELTKLGYSIHIQPKDKACDHGAPTIRQRLVMVARRDGQPINIPKPTHGRADGVTDLFAPKVKPYRTAAEIIDWSIPCPSIFTRKKPLAAATHRRIARGMVRFVVDNANPFIVPLTHQGDARVYSLDEPLRTITSAHRGELALATPFVARCDQTSAANRNGIHSLGEPVRTITTSGVGALISPFLAGAGGPTYSGKPRPIDVPYKTVVKENHTALFTPYLTKFRANNAGSAITDPAPTVTANSYVKRPGGAVPLGIVAPVILNTRNGERAGQDPRVRGPLQPYPTVTAHGSQGAIAAAFMAKHYGGNETPGADLRRPLSTITTQDHHHLVAAYVSNFYTSNTRGGEGDMRMPLKTVTAGGQHQAAVHAFLTKYFSEGGTNASVAEPMHTITTKDRFSLVTTSAGTFPMTDEEIAGARRVAKFMKKYANDNRFNGEDFVLAAGVPIVDIGMRMLDLRELYRAQGFPDDYIIAPKVWRIVRGKLVYGPLPKTDGTRMCGNSVSPYQAKAWIEANAPPEFYRREERRAA